MAQLGNLNVGEYGKAVSVSTQGYVLTTATSLQIKIDDANNNPVAGSPFVATLGADTKSAFITTGTGGAQFNPVLPGMFQIQLIANFTGGQILKTEVEPLFVGPSL